MTKDIQKVLLVDSCQEDREIYRSYLLGDKQHTYMILEASTGEEALVLCREQFPEVIVTDYLLPDMNGLELLSSLKTYLCQTNLTVIILTDRGNEQIAVQAMKSGVTDYLVKKNTTQLDLCLAVANVLGKTCLIRQLEESKGHQELERAELRERRQAEEIVQDYAAELEELYNHAPCGYHSLDKDGTFVRMNDTELNMLGYQREEVVGKMKVSDILTPDSLRTFQENFPRFKEQGWIRDLEFDMIRKDGTILPISLSATAIKDAAGNYLFSRSIVVDISERRQAEEKIREQSALLDITSDAVFVRDLECRILYWNRGAERLYGWQAIEVIGRDCRNFLYKQFELISSFLEVAITTVIEQGEWQGELNKITKSGQEIIVHSRWTLMRNGGGQPKFILAVDTDITEKKHLETQFYRAQRLESLGTLASGIAHDLNNILTPIMAVAQLLPLNLLNLNEQNQQLLRILEDSSKRGAELVQQILLYARGAEGKREPLQPVHLLKEIEQVVKSTFPKSIQICVDISIPKLGTIFADPTQIHQVLMNLCVNARDAMPDGGTISISAKNFSVDQNYSRMSLEAKEGEYVVITVSDTGCGIPTELQERIFEPFFTTKETSRATGLGLSTVFGIVKNHGGFIQVESEVGRGTKFKIYLPILDGSIAQPIKDIEICAGNGELILFVDDEVAIQEISKSLLLAHNYRVLTASHGIEALAVYAEYRHQIDVIVIDLMMPSLDGITTIRTLRKINPAVKIVAISGLGSKEKMTQQPDAVIEGFLSKPYTMQELLKILSSVLKS
jgi:PAS domain S-box-containing protein